MRILIADDDRDSRDILARRLNRRGYAALAVEDGAQALAALDVGAYDAVLLDSLMPNLSGLEVLRQLRARGDLTTVIMVSGKALTADVETALSLGADGYVIKPMNFEKLVALIER